MCQPLRESRSIFWLHRDKLHAHAFFRRSPLHFGPRSYFSCRYINQQLDESSGRRRFKSANVQPTQPKIDNSRDHSLVACLPSQDRPFRTGKTRIATKVVRGRH